MEKYYITTAIAYTSGKPHIGNTYEIVLADLLARFKRAQGFDVRFQTGTDEHGEKIELKAAAAGKTPKQFVDEVAGGIKDIWNLMNTSYDKFIRTTDADHEAQIKKMFKKNILTMLAAALVSGGMKDLKKVISSDEIGGTAQLGISKPVIKAHGSSNGYAFKNAIRQARDVASSGIIEDITANVDVMKLSNSAEAED